MRLPRRKGLPAPPAADTKPSELSDGSGQDNHPLAILLEAFFKVHGGKPEDPEWKKFLYNFNMEVATKVKELSEPHGVEGKFGFSSMAGCSRAAHLKLRGEKGQFSGSKHMTFLTGHLLEAVAIAAIKAIGIEIKDVQPRLNMGNFASTTADAVIKWDGEWVFLSVKTTGYKKSAKSGGKWELRGWPAVAVNGIYKENTSAWVQSQAEMGSSGEINKTIVLVIAKDTIDSMADHPVIEKIGSLAFYAEAINLDPVFFNYLSQKWEKEHEDAEEPLHNITPTYFNADSRKYVNINTADMNWEPNAKLAGKWNPCRYCDVSEACKAAHIKFMTEETD